MNNHNDQTQAPVMTADPAPQAYPPTMEGYAQGPYVMPPPIYPTKDCQQPEGAYHHGEETTTRGGGSWLRMLVGQLLGCLCDYEKDETTSTTPTTTRATN